MLGENYSGWKICAIVAWILIAAAYILANAYSLPEPVWKNFMREILGREDRITPSKSRGSSNYEYKKIVVKVNGGAVIWLVSYTGEVSTEKNIRQGSTLDEVLDAYGRRACVVEYISLRFVLDAAEKIWLLEHVRTI